MEKQLGSCYWDSFSINLFVLQPERRKTKQEDEYTYWDIQLEKENLDWVVARQILLSTNRERESKRETQALIMSIYLKPPTQAEKLSAIPFSWSFSSMTTAST
jgi:hypothetical protein